jgi:radical SAM superfamily enzyme YgiQ (UPF0313 family)
MFSKPLNYLTNGATLKGMMMERQKQKRTVVLINPGSDSAFKGALRERYNYPPYGLLSIASILRSHGYEVHLIDLMVLGTSKAEFIQELSSFKQTAIAVGISTYTETMHLALEVSRIAKRILPEARIILGGVHVSFCPEEGIKDPSVDFVVNGEGESTIIALLELIKYEKYIRKEEIRGISYKVDSECVSTGVRNRIQDLNHLPFPAYDLVANNVQYSNMITLVSSRGCPGQCIFCASGAFSGRRYRMHSAEWLFSLLYYYKSKLSTFSIVQFIDDTFTVNKARIKKFFFYVQKNKWSFIWACKSRVDVLDEETIRILADSGCKSIHIGVESGDQSVLDAIDKNIKLEQCLKVIALLNKYSIRPECSLMIGLPSDSLETIDKTLILAAEIANSKLGLATIGIATPFPGTKMYEKAQELGMIINTFDWRNYTTFKPIFHTDNFSIQDIRKAYCIFRSEKQKLKENSIVSNSDMSNFRKAIQAWISSVTAMENDQCLTLSEDKQ